jgi:hypothetical protein
MLLQCVYNVFAMFYCIVVALFALLYNDFTLYYVSTMSPYGVVMFSRYVHTIIFTMCSQCFTMFLCFQMFCNVLTLSSRCGVYIVLHCFALFSLFLHVPVPSCTRECYHLCSCGAVPSMYAICVDRSMFCGWACNALELS